jgi:hypothetical protein
MNDIIGCIARGLIRDLINTLTTIIIWVGLALALSLLLCLASGNAGVCLPGWIGGVGVAIEYILIVTAVMTLASLIINGVVCIANAAFNALADITGVTVENGAAISSTDCASAKAELTAKQDELVQVTANRNLSRIAVDQAQRNLESARIAFVLTASAAAAISLFAPMIIQEAIAISIAAGIFLGVRSRQLAEARHNLDRAELSYESAIRAEANARAIANQACQNEEHPPNYKSPQ